MFCIIKLNLIVMEQYKVIIFLKQIWSLLFYRLLLKKTGNYPCAESKPLKPNFESDDNEP
jgi:hypothetical protein